MRRNRAGIRRTARFDAFVLVPSLQGGATVPAALGLVLRIREQPSHQPCDVWLCFMLNEWAHPFDALFILVEEYYCDCA